MVNQTPGQPEYEYDWQNPNHKTFDFGKVFGNAFSSFFGNFKALLLPLLVASLALSLFTTIATASMVDQMQDFIEDPTGGNFGGYMAFTVGTNLVSLFLAVWFQIVVIHKSYAYITKNDKFSENSIQKALKFLVPVFFMALIYLIVCIAGFYALLIGFVFVWPGWALAGPVYIVERKGVFGSLGRAWTLAKGNKRWILLLLIVLGAILFCAYLIVFFIMALGGAGNVFDPNSIDLSTINYYSPVMIAMTVLSSFVSLTSYGVFASAITAAYVEIRGIKEGESETSKIFS